MAATKFSCPECGKVLRPAKPLPAGKRVKCPQCSAMFETQDDEMPTSAAAAKAGAKGAAKAGAKPKPKPAAKPAKPAAKPKAAKKAEAAKTPANTIPLKDDDDDGGPATYSFGEVHNKDDEPDIEYAPDTSIKDLRGPAQAAVMMPSNFMIMFSVIGFLGYLTFAMVILIPTIFPNPKPTNPDGSLVVEKKQAGEEGKESTGSMFMILTWDLMTVPEWRWWQITLLIGGCVLGMMFCSVAIYGGVQVQTLTSRTWGMVSSVLVMLPALSTGSFAVICIILTFLVDFIMDRDAMIYVFPIWVLLGYGPNLGFGIWGMITLLRPDVIDGFEYVPE